MVDIVLVTWGRPDLTRATIDSIKKNTKRENYRLIVIDNASSGPLVPMLKEYEAEGTIGKLILNDTNRGLEPARNQGLTEVVTPFFVCVDNDLLCPPIKDGRDWVERMERLMQANRDYAAIAMRTQIMIGTGNIFDGHEEEELIEFPHPGGSYRMMRTGAVMSAGGWREEVGGRGSEEKHICGKLLQMGFKTGFTVQIKSLHLFGDRDTDGWGYPKEWKPRQSGHSEVWHPIFASGDDPQQIDKFMDTGEYE